MSSNTVVGLPEAMRDAIRRTANQGLMTAWINNKPHERRTLDVGTSWIFYDGAGTFECALDNEPNPFTLKALYNNTRVRFYSNGI